MFGHRAMVRAFGAISHRFLAPRAHDGRTRQPDLHSTAFVASCQNAAASRLGTHFTRASDIIVPDYLTTSPSVPIEPYRDMFGNGAAGSSLPPAATVCIRQVSVRLSGDLLTVFPRVISGLRKPIAIQAATSLNMDLPE
jgi:hypothetical protein